MCEPCKKKREAALAERRARVAAREQYEYSGLLTARDGYSFWIQHVTLNGEVVEGVVRAHDYEGWVEQELVIKAPGKQLMVRQRYLRGVVRYVYREALDA